MKLYSHLGVYWVAYLNGYCERFEIAVDVELQERGKIIETVRRPDCRVKHTRCLMSQVTLWAYAIAWPMLLLSLCLQRALERRGCKRGKRACSSFNVARRLEQVDV